MCTLTAGSLSFPLKSSAPGYLVNGRLERRADRKSYSPFLGPGLLSAAAQPHSATRTLRGCQKLAISSPGMKLRKHQPLRTSSPEMKP
jgi:hypothetical protein